jgi:hypothetical protein
MASISQAKTTGAASQLHLHDLDEVLTLIFPPYADGPGFPISFTLVGFFEQTRTSKRLYKSEALRNEIRPHCRIAASVDNVSYDCVRSTRATYR